MDHANYLKNAINLDKELRDYQKDYYNKLVEKSKGDSFHSLICIPTGGGKTRLAVIFLIMNILSSDKKILWIAHSQYLLNQAYDTFSKYLKSEWLNNFSILIHSGEHDEKLVQKISDINEKHRLIICSFQSLQKTTRDWKRVVGDKTFLVIDEAHHIVAPSYFKLLEDYMISKNVIGLTATPIRMNHKESNKLYKIFNIDLGIQIHMTTLFQNKHLVRPLFEIVYYNNDDQIDQKTIDNISTVDELNKHLLENSEDYNKNILAKYSADEAKYGKTVIFAINKEHANSLYELFCKKYGNNKVFLVYSDLTKNKPPHLPANTTKEEQFNDFKNSSNGILININVLNEGVDIPDIQTVFLTKPLNSRTTVTQIIGRALRTSPETNKTCAYIVNFAVNNLGKKLLMVMPKIAYNQYYAEWESNEAINEIEKNEKRITKLSEVVESVKKKSQVCSFSDVCLAGNYTIISSNETEDIPVPVSFKEYQNIERFRKGKTCSFPKTLFFCELNMYLLQEAFKNANQQYTISFKPYDAELLDGITNLLSEIKNAYSPKSKRKDYENFIALKYDELIRKQSNENVTVLWYLDQVGIRTKESFIYFMKQEIPIFKQQILEDKL